MSVNGQPYLMATFKLSFDFTSATESVAILRIIPARLNTTIPNNPNESIVIYFSTSGCANPYRIADKNEVLRINWKKNLKFVFMGLGLWIA